MKFKNKQKVLTE